MIAPTEKVSSLPYIGPAVEQKLKRLDITTVSDLIWYLPQRYEDLSKKTTITSLLPDSFATIRGHIESLHVKRTYRRHLVISEMVITDETGTLKATWFGQRYLDKTFNEGDEVYLAGKAKKTLLGFEMINPIYEKVSAEQLHTGHLIPYYRLTEGISQRQLRFFIATALKHLGAIPDELPQEIRENEELHAIDKALRIVHAPHHQHELDHAIRRLKFEELFWLQLQAGYSRRLFMQGQAPVLQFKKDAITKYIQDLPFTLTADQKKVAWQILKDTENIKPSHRLVEGDVGSGKTVVASIIMLNSVLNGYQTVLMAPTELLATQHYAELLKLFRKQDLRIALLTSEHTQEQGTPAARSTILKHLKNHAVDIVVGTHSLIQEGVRLKNVGSIVIDEQHRFGVAQRKQLTEISNTALSPHVISLTATPIPRTLALTLYGELSISTIRQKPKGRKPIITRYVAESKRDQAYTFIRNRAALGEQIFIICPLIEESDTLETKSVLEEFEHLQKNIFPDLKLRFLHGRMKAAEKQTILQDLKEKKYPILVTTSVIEVGIDIPGATIMVIEGADRFGLAQLHQFRGRVGRNDIQSYCFLFSSSQNPNTVKRLQLLTRYQDGFALAEADLKMRGEGEVFGTRQSGLVNFKIATIHDTELIKKSRGWVDRVLNAPPSSGLYQAVSKRVEQMDSVHWE